MNDDTIYAPATVPGTGAISIIRVSGAEAFGVTDKIVSCRRGKITDAKGYTILFGTVRTKDGKVLDEVLVSVFRAPHSYTGEDSVEISCHASSYIVGEIMSMLAEAGARAAAPGEFTQRAFLNGKMDLAQAEAVADVIASQNATAHRVAFSQMKGGFSSELKDMRAELLEMVSLMELELDFSEEDVEFADRSRLVSLLERTIAHIGRLSDSFRLGNAIKNGVPVAIVGATNAGKSTLLNALLGEERAIVSDIHGTTRDTIEETLNVNGVLFRFIDTAGLRETADAIEKIGIERSYSKLHSAQIVLGVLDGSRPEDDFVRSAEEILSQVNFDEQRLWLLVNKCDNLVKADERFASTCSGCRQIEEGIEANTVLALHSDALYAGADCTFSVSCKEKEGVEGNNGPVDITRDVAGPALGRASRESLQFIRCKAAAEQKGMEHSNEITKEALPEQTAEQNDMHHSPAFSSVDGRASENIDIQSSAGSADFAHNKNVKILNNIISHIHSEQITIIGISAKSGYGLDTLRSGLAASQKDIFSCQDTTLVTNQRHYDALVSASASLSRVKSGLSSGIPTDLTAQDIREALYTLGTIVGEISTDEVLGNIFQNFCIGK